MGSRDPGLYVWLREEVLAHFLALKLMLTKTQKGLEGSIISLEPTWDAEWKWCIVSKNYVRRFCP